MSGLLEELNQAYEAFLQTNSPEEKKMLCTRCRKREVYDNKRLFGHPLCQDCTDAGYLILRGRRRTTWGKMKPVNPGKGKKGKYPRIPGVHKGKGSGSSIVPWHRAKVPGTVTSRINAKKQYDKDARRRDLDT